MTAVSELCFKQTLSTLFNINTTATQIGHQSITVYKGIQFTPNPGSTEANFDSLPKPWFLESKTDSEVILCCKTSIFVNEVEILKEVHIDCSGSVTIHMRNRVVMPCDVGLPDSIYDSNTSLNQYLIILENMHTCLGKEIPSSVSEICRYKDQLTMRKRSPTCHTLMPVLASGNTCQRCHSMSDSHPTTSTVTIEDDSEGEHQQPNHSLPDVEPIPPDIDISFFFPNANETLMGFIQAQSLCCNLDANGKDARSRRWNANILSLALSVWIASPTAYRILGKSLYLPSEKLLQLYKNSVNKNPGVNEEMLTWMYEEFNRTDSPKVGGVVFDEMTIQSGLQLQPHSSGLDMFGYVDFGEENSGIANQNKSAEGIELATTALQFVFLALNGFRFPFAYILNHGLTSGQLTTLFWDIVSKLQTYEFDIKFVCMDGASTNRRFFNMIRMPGTYIARNICNFNATIACIMDYSHVIKKIRNSLFASGPDEEHKRSLLHPSGNIYWEYFTKAFTWDCNTHYLRIHRKLTNDHFNLNSYLKMRNHLAEQVLNSDMLILFLEYQKSLNSDMLILFLEYQKSLSDPTILDAVIELVTQTSKLVTIFRSHSPIMSMEDPRLAELSSVVDYFHSWNLFTEKERKKYKRKKEFFITTESYLDLQSCINGFLALCQEQVATSPIIPAIINSDVVENIFCQQRAIYNGPNTHPDALQYRYFNTLLRMKFLTHHGRSHFTQIT